MRELELGLGMDISWTAPYWYDGLRSWAYGYNFVKDKGYLAAGGTLLGLTISVWYSR